MSIRSSDTWHARATGRAVAAVRKIVADLPAEMPISHLSDIQIGWVVSAALFAWIACRAEEAATEGVDAERIIRMTGQEPDPWDIGAIEAILPVLGEIKADWSKPLAEWSRDEIVSFLFKAFNLVNEGLLARDRCDDAIIRKSNAAEGLGTPTGDPVIHMLRDLEEPPF